MAQHRLNLMSGLNGRAIFRHNRFFLAILLGLVCLIVLPGCNKGAPASANASADETPPPPEVTVAKPIEQEITDYFEFPGQTAAVGEVEVRARVTGYLMKVNFEDGQLVKKGDLLYEIDPRPYQATLDKARGDLARLEALLEKAKANLARSERLRPSGAVSEDEVEQHRANLKVGEASLQSSNAAVREAELNLEFTKIHSPIDGRVSRTRITEGNLVQANFGESAVLTTVVTTSPIYVYFNVDEQALLEYITLASRTKQDFHLNRLKKLKVPVEIGLGNEKGFPHAGVFDFADNKVDRSTGTIRARGIFDNENGYLTPGMFVRMRIPLGKPHRALLVPERAIGRDQRERFLLVVGEKNIVERRRIEVGTLRDGLRVVTSGVEPNDRIVVLGLQRAAEGKPVTPVEASETTAGEKGKTVMESKKADGGPSKK